MPSVTEHRRQRCSLEQFDVESSSSDSSADGGHRAASTLGNTSKSSVVTERNLSGGRPFGERRPRRLQEMSCGSFCCHIETTLLPHDVTTFGQHLALRAAPPKDTPNTSQPARNRILHQRHGSDLVAVTLPHHLYANIVFFLKKNFPVPSAVESQTARGLLVSHLFFSIFIFFFFFFFFIFHVFRQRND